MRCICEYNPITDIQPVSQTGFVDLAKANATSEIDVPIANEEEKFNGIDDPRSIGSRPSDVFEAMQANKAIVGYEAPKEDNPE